MDMIWSAKAVTLFCQPSSSGPFIPVTRTASSATFVIPLASSSSFMIGMTRSQRSCSSWVGSLPVFLSGLGAPWVVRIAYLVPGSRVTLRRNLRAFPSAFLCGPVS